MNPTNLSRIAKLTAGTVVVLAAVCIALPELLGYLSGLWRLGLWIALVLAVAVISAAVFVRLKAHKRV